MNAILVGELAGNDDFRDTCNQKNEVLIGGGKVTRNLIIDLLSTSDGTGFAIG